MTAFILHNKYILLVGEDRCIPFTTIWICIQVILFVQGPGEVQAGDKLDQLFGEHHHVLLLRRRHHGIINGGVEGTRNGGGRAARGRGRRMEPGGGGVVLSFAKGNERWRRDCGREVGLGKSWSKTFFFNFANSCSCLGLGLRNSLEVVWDKGT
jgi:hypothetical protein